MNYLTAKDIAARLQISLSAAYQLLRSGKIKRYKGVGGVRVEPAELERYIEEQTKASEPKPFIIPMPIRRVFSGHFAGLEAD